MTTLDSCKASLVFSVKTKPLTIVKDDDDDDDDDGLDRRRKKKKK